MLSLRSRVVDGRYKFLESVLKVANGFPSLGLGLSWACPYTYQLSLVPDLGFSPQGVLKDGRPYDLVHIDAANPKEKENGVAHYYIGCISDGKELGRVRIWAGDKYINELDRLVRFDGWYLYDAFVEPDARRLGVFRMCTLYGMRVAKESGLGGKYYSGFTHAYNRAAMRAFETMGFTKEPTILFVKVLGKRWWKNVSNRAIS